MRSDRLKLTMELVSRCVLLAVMDIVLAQRFGIPKMFTSDDSYVYAIFLYFVWWILNLAVFAFACMLLFQRLRQLVDAFSFILAAAILYLSYAINQSFVHNFLVEPGKLWKYYYASYILVVQFILASLYILVRTKVQYNRYGIFTSESFRQSGSVAVQLLFCLPTIFHFVGLSAEILEWLTLASATFAQLELGLTLCLQLPHIVDTIERNIISLRLLLRDHGIQLVIESQWVRLRVPTLLQIYWICKLMLETGLILIQERILEEDEEIAPSVSLYDMDVTKDPVQNLMFFEGRGNSPDITTNGTSIDLGYIANATQAIILKGCDGVIPLLGMTTIVSKLTHYLGVFLAILVDSTNEDDKNMGTMCGILFFVLALQTGLTRLEPSKRLIRLYRNMCLLSTAILHFVHSMIHPLMMTMSASRTMPMSKHIRVLSMCAFLLVFPALLLCYLWTTNTISPWLLAVTAFSVEVMIKVIISLLIYALFMIDSRQETFWEALDDYIYYIKATGNTIEFLFGIFLFCNGAWIMLFESGGMIRAFMMCIHAYFNIWIQACDGWKVFMKRRTAVHKINSLPEATPQQLRINNDVCSICHENLESARITRCHHFFHSVCLRKWLYHQDTCPLCHQQIYKVETSSDNESDQGEDNVIAQGDHAHQD